MLGIPKTLLGDMVHLVSGLLGGGGGGGGGTSGALGSLPQNWHTIASYLAGHGFSKYAAAGVAGNIQAESGGLPEQLEIGGGGGGGLIQWTPWQSYGPLITGNASAGPDDAARRDPHVRRRPVDRQPRHVPVGRGDALPGLLREAREPERVTADPEASANAVYQAMWGGGASTGRASGVASRFDSGGWLMPSTVPVNNTGQPEAVLTPQQSQAVVACGGAPASQQGDPGRGSGARR